MPRKRECQRRRAGTGRYHRLAQTEARQRFDDDAAPEAVRVAKVERRRGHGLTLLMHTNARE